MSETVHDRYRELQADVARLRAEVITLRNFLRGIRCNVDAALADKPAAPEPG